MVGAVRLLVNEGGKELVETVTKSREQMMAYVHACFAHQELYMNAALGDAKKSEIDAVFADIAERAGVLNDNFTKQYFLEHLHDWEMAVKPAYTEHKIALGYGVDGTPKHVIEEQLVPDTESAWGATEWMAKLQTL